VTAAQVGAEVAGAAAAVQVNLNTHATNAAAHHAKYTDAEAVTAVGPHVTSVNGLAGGTISSGVTVNGAVSATSVSATTLSGDGSGLSNVPGSVPRGFMIVGKSSTAPPGYTYTGLTVSTSGGFNSWTSRAQIPRPRYGLAAAAVNGKIYVVGGMADIVGSIGTQEVSDNDEYDPATDTWRSVAAMPTPRASLIVVAVNGMIYAIGGGVPNVNDLATNERYDPATDIWVTKAPMPAARSQMAAAAVNSMIYVIGGSVAGNLRATNEVYFPAKNKWTAMAPMPTARHGLAVAAVTGMIYALGGSNSSPSSPGSGGTLDTNEAYNTTTDIWVTKAPMPTARVGLAAATTNGKVYVIGGEYSTEFAANEVYNPATNTWAVMAPMPTARSLLAATAVNGTIYALGGISFPALLHGANEAYSTGALFYLHRKN